MDVETAIRSRRTHKAFGPSRSRATLDELLELARWAPNHHLTNPWRFRVLGPRALERLKDGRPAPEAAAKLDRAPTLVAVTARTGEDPVQDEEDLCATASRPMPCCLPRTGAASRATGEPRSPAHRRRAAAVEIPPDERFVALLHLGWPRQEKAPPEREPVSAVVSFLD